MSDLFSPHDEDSPREKRVCEAPIPFGSVMAQTGHALEAYWRSEWARDPVNTLEPGKCKFCGCQIEEPLIVGSDLIQFPVVACDPCIKKRWDEMENEAWLKSEKAFHAVIPIEFSYWNNSKGNNDALQKALLLFAPANRKGMVLHGLTGTCKTRILWQLVKRVIEQPEALSWLMLDGYEIATSATPFPKEAFFCDYLFIDDLGNGPSSFKFVTSLLHLIRRRCDWHRPIIVTTQLTGEAFKARFFNDPAASAIIRRFRERTENLQT